LRSLSLKYENRSLKYELRSKNFDEKIILLYYLNMTQSNSNNPVTKKELVEVLGTFTEDLLLPAVENIMDNKLGEHTHEMGNMMDQKLAKHTHEMKNYIDSKLAEQKGDIISYIKGDRERDNNWKLKVVEILKRNKLANPKELELLANFVK